MRGDVTTVSTLTAREAYCCALANGPLLPADAVVVFSGDGTTRLAVAVGILKQRGAHMAVVSGGVDDPPHSLSAPDSAEYLIRNGLAPDRIVQDNESRNTHEQSEWVAEAIVAETWPQSFGRIFLAVSPYHMYRAHLTLIQSLRERDLDMRVHVLPVAASQTSWWKRPEGVGVDRMELLEDEFRKIEEYQAKGHVATWEQGLGYLRFWEGDDE